LQPLLEARISAANSPKEKHFMRIAREVLQKRPLRRKAGLLATADTDFTDESGNLFYVILAICGLILRDRWACGILGAW
jgi:hypothetical protein